MPGLSAKGKTNQWMARQRDKFAYILQMMRELRQDRMGGMRVEFRLSCILEDWAGLKEFLIHKLLELQPHLYTLQIPREAILASMEAALRATSEVGRFSTAAGAGQHLEVPEWKLVAYQRLIHRFGLSNKYGHKRDYKAECNDEPWKPVEDVGQSFG